MLQLPKPAFGWQSQLKCVLSVENVVLGQQGFQPFWSNTLDNHRFSHIFSFFMFSNLIARQRGINASHFVQWHWQHRCLWQTTYYCTSCVENSYKLNCFLWPGSLTLSPDVPLPEEQLSCGSFDSCLSTSGKFMFLCTASPECQRPLSQR